MRLSEAIRLGAMLNPQGFGELCVLRDGRFATCALGAAEEAVNEPFDEVSADDAEDGKVYEVYSELFTHRAACPACGSYHSEIDEVIVHLNDWHRWARERIADWVALVESPQDVDAVARPVASQHETPIRA